jgi:hypothetical protein
MFAVIVRFQQLSYDLGLSGAQGAFIPRAARILVHLLPSATDVVIFAGYFGPYGGSELLLFLHCCIIASIDYPQLLH